MPVRFSDADGTVEAGLRRIAGGQIDALLEMIRAGTLPPEKIIHEARRTCKSIRGLMRLVKPVFPAFALENAAFRDIARSLSAARDAKVLADALTALQQDDDPHAMRRQAARSGAGTRTAGRFPTRGFGEATRGCAGSCRDLDAARRRLGRARARAPANLPIRAAIHERVHAHRRSAL